MADKFPPCAAGTWAWGGGVNSGKMIFGQSYDENALKETFERAYSLGFTLWDTAEVYGMGTSERLLAQCIAEKKKQGLEVMISTKHMPGKKYTKGSVRKALEGSVSRLGIDRADIYWLHLPFNIEENVGECIELMAEGKIGTVGVSNYNLEQIKKADGLLREKGLRLGAVQNHFSLLRYDSEQRDIIAWCSENDVTYFSYMVMEQGALSGRYDENNTFPTISLRGLAFGKRKFVRIRELIAYERQLAEKYGVNTSQIPVAWAIAKGTVPIIGLTKARYAEELRQGCELRLENEEILRLEELAAASGVVCKGIWEPSSVFGGRR